MCIKPDHVITRVISNIGWHFDLTMTKMPLQESSHSSWTFQKIILTTYSVLFVVINVVVYSVEIAKHNGWWYWISPGRWCICIWKNNWRNQKCSILFLVIARIVLSPKKQIINYKIFWQNWECASFLCLYFLLVMHVYFCLFFFTVGCGTFDSNCLCLLRQKANALIPKHTVYAQRTPPWPGADRDKLRHPSTPECTVINQGLS